MKFSEVAFTIFIVATLFCISPASSQGGGGNGRGRGEGSGVRRGGGRRWGDSITLGNRNGGSRSGGGGKLGASNSGISEGTGLGDFYSSGKRINSYDTGSYSPSDFTGSHNPFGFSLDHHNPNRHGLKSHTSANNKPADFFSENYINRNFPGSSNPSRYISESNPVRYRSRSYSPSHQSTVNSNPAWSNGLFTYETKPSAPKVHNAGLSSPVQSALNWGVPNRSISQRGTNGKTGCIQQLPPKQGQISCFKTGSGMICDASCNNGFVFYNKTTELRIECFNFVGYWMPANHLPECKPFCPKPCQNGGVCIGPGKCRCSESYRGQQCQHKFPHCDIREFAKSNRIEWVCNHSSKETSCSVTCRPPWVFTTPPAEEYHCYPNGTWIPGAIPDCID